MLRRLVVLPVGVLLALSGSPAGHAATVHRSTPTVTLTVTPRYPRVGQTAGLTVRVGGARGRATGWVRIRFDGNVIADCRHLVLHKGVGSCTAPRTWRAERIFTVGYRGSSVYSPRTIVRHVWS